MTDVSRYLYIAHQDRQISPCFGERLFLGDSGSGSARKSLMGDVSRFLPRGVPRFFTRKLCCNFTWVAVVPAVLLRRVTGMVKVRGGAISCN